MRIIKYLLKSFGGHCHVRLHSGIAPDELKTIYSAKAPIILIPGFWGSGRYFVPLKQYLETHGYRAFFYFKTRLQAPLYELATELCATIASVKGNNITLITHSTGAIIALRALKDRTIRHKIKQVIALSAPFNGSFWGSLLIASSNYRYLRYNSPDLQQLRENLTINRKFVSLYPRFDEIVLPPSSFHLPGGQHKKIPTIGHMNMLLDKQMFNEVLTFLA